MNLASHSDPRVHARYVMRTLAIRTVPPEALPALPMGALTAEARDDSRSQVNASSRAETRKLSALQDSRGSGCRTRP
jgi:hypothetical protein